MNLLLLSFLCCVSLTCGYHILCVFPIPTHSHNQLGKGIVDTLLKEGHTVTWVTPFPEKAGKNIPKTLNVFDASEVQKFITDTTISVAMFKEKRKGLSYVKEYSANITKTVLTNSAMVDLLVNVQFDAVVTEAFFSDVMAGIAAVQQVPWILLSGTQMNPLLEVQVDEIRSITTVPLMFNDASIPMSFVERATNVIIFIAITISDWFDRPATEALYKDLFSPIASARNVPLPPFEDAYHNVSILLLNSHESLSPTFSIPPNVIQIAGYHIDENPPPLTKDLKELLDNSKNGVIYFSMGSILRSDMLKPHTVKAMLAKFAALPYTILWKFETEINEKLPPNVHIRSWMPQLSILEHPNVKVFITHGGQLSTLEAVRAGVPLLAIPVFGDQPANADRAVKAGYALKATFSPDMADEIDVKLREILNNPTYSNRVKHLSKLFRGRPVAPSKLVSHYIQLAIETKGAHHLRSVSLQYTWIQRCMLDVIVALLVGVCLSLTLLTLTIRACWRCICGTTNKQQQKNEDRRKKKN